MTEDLPPEPDGEPIPVIKDHFLEPLSLLHQAAASKCGIIVHTDDVELAKQRFYRARAQVKEEFPELLDLSIRTSPENPTSEVLIVKSNLKEAFFGQQAVGRPSELQDASNHSEGPTEED